MKRYVGLDVHSKFTVFVVQNEEGRVIAEGRAPTTAEGLSQIAEVAGSLRDCVVVGLETGVQAKWVARVLKQLELQPVVLDAREVRTKARRRKQKTDRRDAFEICDGLRRDQFVTRVWMPSEVIERLRSLLSRRRHFVRMRTAEVNATKFVLRQQGKPRPKTLRSRAAWEAMGRREDLDEATRGFIARHQAAWQICEEQVRELDGEIKQALEEFGEIGEILQSMPGVGPIVAASFIAAIGDPARFESSAQVVSYLGLAPSMHDSGQSERHGSITKQGSTWARTMLIEAAHHASRPRHPLYPYWARMAARCGVKKAAVAVAQRMARILWRMWRDGKGFDVKRLNVVYEPGTVRRPVYYRMKRVEEVKA